MKPSIKSFISALLLALLPITRAGNVLYTSSLNPCQANNQFSATLFDVVFTPNNGSLAIHVSGVSTINGNVTIDLVVIAYGLQAYTTTINPCEAGLSGLCPMNEGQIDLPDSNIPIPKGVVDNLPGE